MARSRKGRAARGTPPRAAGLLDDLEFRSIGPYRSGRVSSVAGDPVDPQVFYMGTSGGGVWKTTDAGLVWENVSDGYFERSSVGAVAVASSDPNVIYVGMGESCIRGDASHGDGVYRSDDAGRSWRHLGLADTRHIGKIRIAPADPDTAYVAALGHAHGPNESRGVYKTTDGGRTWRRTLWRSPEAGAIDISIDPLNPRILYASTWQTTRTPWSLQSGGPGSGIFRSSDGGESWTELSGRGLPDGVLGRIGIAASPARSGVAWALVEANGGGVFRTEDHGETWNRTSDDRRVQQRPWYCNHVFADPRDPETVWILSVGAWRSTDGGRSFSQVAFPHGDHHDLWIDPRNPQRIIGGNDGGATVSFNGGSSWSSTYNQPTAEFYHVTTDRQTPYRVYGAQQDYGTISVPSRSALLAITHAEAYDTGGSESSYIAVRPDDHNIVYGGSYQPPRYLSRYDHRTGQARQIMVWPESTAGAGAKEARYRFQWTHPVALSPHDPDILYVAGDRLFRSTDEGTSWEAISPDLTRNDVTKQESSGGPITKDNTGAEYYCTIFSFAESPITPGLLWVGSDDGLVHVSANAGKTWLNVTPAALPEWTTVGCIEASPHDPDEAFVVAFRYKLDDFRPLIYRTTNRGRTWTKVTKGIRPNDFARVVREDPAQKGLLYCGTETGLYFSVDGGGNWERWQGKRFPVVPVHDVVVHDDDLVIATHGRSFWIFDDLTPLRDLAAGPVGTRPHLSTPRPTTRFYTNPGFGHEPLPGIGYRTIGAQTLTYRQHEDPTTGRKWIEPLNAGTNPPDGVLVSYHLPKSMDVTLTFRDARKRKIVSYSSASQDKGQLRAPSRRGFNRFVWNMRYPGARRLSGTEASMGAFAAGLEGPLAPPGRYFVELKADTLRITVPFELRKDPRTNVPPEDFDEQFQLLLRIRDKISEIHEAVDQIRSARERLKILGRGGSSRSRTNTATRGRPRELARIEDELLQGRAVIRQDTLNFPIRLNAKLGGLAVAVASADGKPIRSAYEVFESLSRRTDRQINAWRAIQSKLPWATTA